MLTRVAATIYEPRRCGEELWRNSLTAWKLERPKWTTYLEGLDRVGTDELEDNDYL